MLGLDVPRDGMRLGRADCGVWVLRDERREPVEQRVSARLASIRAAEIETGQA